MKRLCNLIIILFSSLMFAQDNFPLNGVKETNQLYHAFINVDIMINYKDKIDNATLLIKGSEILEVGSKVKLPKGTIIHDFEGLTICPSFIEIYNTEFQSTVNDNTEIDSWNSSINSDYHAVNYLILDPEKSTSYIKEGFGAINSLSNNEIINGTSVLFFPSLKKIHESIISKNSAISFSLHRNRGEYPNSLMGSIALLRQTFYDAQWYSQQKNHFNVSLESFNQNKSLPKIIKTNNLQSILRADKISSEFNEEFIIKTNGTEYQRIDDIKKTWARLIVPLNFPELDLPNGPYDSFQYSLSELKHWEMAPFNTVMLSEKNIPFAITTDGLDDLSDFSSKLNLALSHGLSNTEALKALTYQPANFLNTYKKLGSISKGKIANFLVFSGELFGPDFIIYQNWVHGEKHIINNLNNFKILGDYYLFFNDEKILVDLKINDGNLVGIARIDSTEINLESLKFLNHTLSFKIKGNMFSGIKGENKIYGEVKLDNGNWSNWELVKTADQIKEEEEKTTFNRTQILYPNMAYGLEKQPEQKSILFTNATVWTNETRGVIENCDVAIQNGKILSVGQDLSTNIFKNKNFEIIDLTNKHLTSGIVDEHSHIAISGGVNESGQAVTSEVRIGDVINANDVNIYRQLSGGVTTAQLLHGSANPIGGQSAIIKLRWGQLAGKLKFKNAKPFIKFALGENVKQSNWGDSKTTRYPQTRMGVEQIFYDRFIQARSYEKEWKEYNKMSSWKKKNTPQPRKDLELDALVEILNKKRFITCHSYIQSEINMLMHIADSLGFKINTFTHILDGYKVADKLKSHGANASTFSDWWAYKYEVNDAIPYNAALLLKMGVNTSINSDDAEMGRRLNQEAAKLVKYGGISQEEAWKTVTLNPAKMLHIDQYVGSLRKNKDADIVIWSDNPLSMYAIVEQTYVDGRCYYDLESDANHREKIKIETARLLKKLMTEK